MRCVACGVELLPGKRFCHACGAPAAAVCSGCGAALDPSYRFCPDCGTAATATATTAAGRRGDPLARVLARRGDGVAHAVASAAPLEGERKQVTVVFCDLVGSTAIASQLDPEEYHELLEEYFEIVFPEIYRLEGVVNQLAGDGLMALFGAPIAHEDAPHRAVKAALAIQEAVAPLAERLRARRGVALRLRVGINTGPVVVGPVGNDRKMDYTAIGDTTNLAARLQTLAEPGTVLISEATWRLVRGFVDADPTGPLAVRGKDEPVSAWVVRAWKGAATSFAAAEARGLTPFVGRDAELARLDAAFVRAAAGETQVVAVVGDAGSGKSRLLYEFRHRLGDERAVVFEGRCASMMQALPYHAFMSMMARWFELDWDEPVESACAKVATRFGVEYPQLEQMYPVLCRFLSLPIEGLADQPPDELRRETFDAIARLVLGATAQKPVVMVLEDLHWIDEPSFELLEDLLRRIAGHPVLVLVTHRPDAAPPWHVAVALTQLVLARLADHDVHAIVRGAAGAALPAELEEVLAQKAAGSPFFAEELVRGLVDERHLVNVDGDGTLALARPLSDIPIPGTVQEVIAARLDALSPAAKRVVQVAAVLGRQFRRAQLEHLLDGEGIDVARELAELERRGLVHRKSMLSADELRFGESLTQEVAYETLLHRQRRQLHERVGRLLEAETDGGPGAESAALLAHHWERSDDHAKAVDALLRAAYEAERVPSYRAAAELYHRAWKLAESLLPEREDGRFHKAALDAVDGICRLTIYFGALDLEEASAWAQRAQELAEMLGDHERLASARYAQGIFMMTRSEPDFAGGLAVAESAIALAHEAGLVHQATRLTRGLAVNYTVDGRFDDARMAIDAVLAQLEATGHTARQSELYVSTRWSRDLIAYASDDYPAAVVQGLDTFELARRTNNRTMRSASAALLAPAQLLRGEYADAIRWSDEAWEIGEIISNSNVLAMAGSVGLLARVALGEPVDADLYLRRIEQGLERAGIMQLHARFVAEALVAAGRLERADDITAMLVRGRGGRLRQAFVLNARGDVLARLRRHDEALACYAEARAFAEEIGARSSLVAAIVGAAEVAVARGQTPRELERAHGVAEAAGLGRYRARLDALAAGGAGTWAPSRT